MPLKSWIAGIKNKIYKRSPPHPLLPITLNSRQNIYSLATQQCRPIMYFSVNYLNQHGILMRDLQVQFLQEYEAVIAHLQGDAQYVRAGYKHCLSAQEKKHKTTQKLMTSKRLSSISLSDELWMEIHYGSIKKITG